MDSGHTVENSEVIVLDREERWLERGIREAIYERKEQPSLNRRGGLRYNLSHSWDRTFKHIPAIKRDTGSQVVTTTATNTISSDEDQ